MKFHQGFLEARSNEQNILNSLVPVGTACRELLAKRPAHVWSEGS